MGQDKIRCQAAKVPEELEFAIKPQLARKMIERAVIAKVPFAWLIGDAVYGNDRRLRVWLEQQDKHFVFAVTMSLLRTRFGLLMSLSNSPTWVNLAF